MLATSRCLLQHNKYNKSHGRMARGGYGLLKVLPGLTMLYPQGRAGCLQPSPTPLKTPRRTLMTKAINVRICFSLRPSEYEEFRIWWHVLYPFCFVPSYKVQDIHINKQNIQIVQKNHKNKQNTNAVKWTVYGGVVTNTVFFVSDFVSVLTKCNNSVETPLW
jgi:hypothetical protein